MKKLRNYVVLVVLFLALFAIKINVCAAYDASLEQSIIPTGYYSSVDTSLSGSAFRENLSEVISEGYVRYPYSASTTDVYDILIQSDINSDGEVVCIYTGTILPKTQTGGAIAWDKEHVWAKSHGFPENPYGDSDPFSDAHNLRPCVASVNRSRSNKDMGEVENPTKIEYECKSDDDVFEPRDEVKGDVARIMFYMATRYGYNEFALSLVDDRITESSVLNGRFGNLQTLIKWHYQDPVSTAEIYRNNVIYTYQKNRNPYIDHPEYVGLAYPNSYSDGEEIPDENEPGQDIPEDGIYKDTLTQSTFGVTATQYTATSGKKATSSAIYASYNAGSNASIQLRSSDNTSGIITTTSGGKLKSVSATFHSNTNSERVLQVYGKNAPYEATTDLYDSSKQGELLGNIEVSSPVTLTISGDYEYVGLRSKDGALYATQIVIEWQVEVEKKPFEIDFSSGNGTFVSGKGQSIIGTVGNAVNVTFPATTDIIWPYAGVRLVGWTDGVNTYTPGSTYEFSSEKTFVPVYKSNLTVAEALAIAESCGSTESTMDLSVTARVSKITTAYNSSYDNITVQLSDDSTANVLTAYRLTGGKDLAVGDYIKVTGRLIKYGSTLEFNSGATYELIEPVAVNFMSQQTKASLSVEYTGTNPTNVDLRFGGIISENAYVAGAKYGVIVLASNNASKLENTNATTAKDLAGEGYYVECQPVKVDGGYQFAWVIDNVEGHYDYEFVAVLYMEYNNKLFLANSTNYSVNTICDYYINMGTLSTEIVNVLTNIKNSGE